MNINVRDCSIVESKPSMIMSPCHRQHLVSIRLSIEIIQLWKFFGKKNTLRFSLSKYNYRNKSRLDWDMFVCFFIDISFSFDILSSRSKIRIHRQALPRVSIRSIHFTSINMNKRTHRNCLVFLLFSICQSKASTSDSKKNIRNLVLNESDCSREIYSFVRRFSSWLREDFLLLTCDYH